MTARLSIDLLRNFVAIVEARGISRAADKVGRTQAALSQQVKRLEDETEQTLMIRGGRGITLTAPGERLFHHALNILRAHDEAVSELTGVSLSGEVRLGCPDDYAIAFLPPLLRDFSNKHPQVFIEVVCAPTPRLLERIKSQMLDIAIVSEPDSPQRDQFLRREHFVWVGVKGGDAQNRDPLQLALSDPDALDYLEATKVLERIGRKYHIAYASGSINGLTAVVRSGHAIAVLTQSAVPPDLVVLPPSRALPALPSIGVTVKTVRRNSSMLLRQFESHIRTMLPTI